MTPQRTAFFAGASLFVVLLLLGGIAYRGTQRLSEQATRVEAAAAVQVELAALINAVTDAELAQGRFVIVGDERYAAMLDDLKARIRDHGARLQRSIIDPQQQRKLAALLQLIERRLALADELVRVRRTQGFDAARARIATGETQRLQTEIRQLSQAMSDAQSAILAARHVDARRWVTETLLWHLALAVVALTGMVVALTMLARQLRRRTQAEHGLSELNALQRAILDGTAHAIIVGDAHGITLFNPAAERLLGYRAQDIVGQHSMLLFHDPEQVRARAQELSAELGRPIEPGMEAFLAKARTGQPDQHEWTYIRQDGSRLPVMLTVTALLNEDGSLRGFVALAEDISARKATEAALVQARELDREARRRAEQADRVKSAFLATMSHELRTPLNSIIGFTGVLLQELAGPLNAEQRKQLTMVRNSSQHLLALINDVLDISKIEAGELKLHSQPFDLRTALQHVAASVEPQLSQKQLAFKMEVAADLGAASGDARRFEQIVLNLLSNAIKFTERGSITLVASRKEQQVQVTVSDTGIGIRSEDLSRLFAPFQQLESSLTRQHEGTGLGLAICKRLAEMMGGTLTVRSEFGRGSAFTFTMPIREEALA